jgi:hypothetical protein
MRVHGELFNGAQIFGRYDGSEIAHNDDILEPFGIFFYAWKQILQPDVIFWIRFNKYAGHECINVLNVVKLYIGNIILVIN